MDPKAALDKLIQIYREDSSHEFPHADCRLIVFSDREKYRDFVAYLDLHIVDIAGLCSRGKKLLELSESELELTRKVTSLSFFEKYPQYAELKKLISKSSTPDLHYCLETYESLRNLLNEVLQPES